MDQVWSTQVRAQPILVIRPKYLGPNNSPLAEAEAIIYAGEGPRGLFGIVPLGQVITETRNQKIYLNGIFWLFQILIFWNNL